MKMSRVVKPVARPEYKGRGKAHPKKITRQGVGSPASGRGEMDGKDQVIIVGGGTTKIARPPRGQPGYLHALRPVAFRPHLTMGLAFTS